MSESTEDSEINLDEIEVDENWLDEEAIWIIDVENEENEEKIDKSLEEEEEEAEVNS